MFTDRTAAGTMLAATLAHLRSTDPLVLGLPRGGVPVAAEVARALSADLDVLVVRKIGAPGQPEYAIGAVGEDGIVVLDRRAAQAAGADDAWLARTNARLRAEVDERVRRFRGDHPMPNVHGRTVIVVDDGLATGSTAQAAVAVLRSLDAGRIVLAVPVGARDTVERLQGLADEVVCLEQPEWFGAVGAHYEDFDQVSDDRVIDILTTYRARRSARDDEVRIPITAHLALPGHCTVPRDAIGIACFAHGSGSSRHSPRNQFVARTLNERGIGTLLFDLLTDDESLDRHNVFDIELLAERLEAAIDWVRAEPSLNGLPVALFGASTGAAAALVAAARRPEDVRAVVSRGGRPDLAGHWLSQVQAPTLLVVGGHDWQVLELNRDAAAHMRCEVSIEIVPGATHLFEDPGTLQQAANLAGDFLVSHLPSR